MKMHPTPISHARRELPLSDVRIGIVVLFTPEMLQRLTLYAERLIKATHGPRVFGSPSIGGLSAEDFVQQAIALEWEGTRRIYVEDGEPNEAGDAGACLKAIKHYTHETISSLIWDARRRAKASADYSDDACDEEPFVEFSLPEVSPEALATLFEGRNELEAIALGVLQGKPRGEIARELDLTLGQVYRLVSRKIKPIVERALERGLLQSI